MKHYLACTEFMDFLSISVTRHSPHHGYHRENTGTLATAVCPMLMDISLFQSQDPVLIMVTTERTLGPWQQLYALWLGGGY